MKRLVFVAALLLFLTAFAGSSFAAKEMLPTVEGFDADILTFPDAEPGADKGKSAQKAIPPINMVFIKGGCFKMGDSTGDGDDDERPVHEVCVDDFYLSETEVTEGLWEAVTGRKAVNPNRPMDKISWRLAVKFIEQLNRLTKGFYRLPTEAEWEYAARAGGKDYVWAGTNDEEEVDEYGWHVDNARLTIHDVRQKKPNPLGLYDMSGNVYEYVEDYFDFDYYKSSPMDNPNGPEFSAWRSARGGSVLTDVKKLRTTFRLGVNPNMRLPNVGFRLAE